MMGGPLVNKAREKDAQKIIDHLNDLFSRIYRTEKAHRVEKNSNVESVTETFARLGINKLVLRTTAPRKAFFLPNKGVPAK